MTRRQFVKSTAVVVPGIVLVKKAGASPGWELRFEKVHDKLQVRLGNSNGQLISWPDRGIGGQYTWSWKDPVPEVRDISKFVGNGDQVSLWARIDTDGQGSGDHQCDMDTRYNGVRKQRWEFDGTEEHDIKR
jgi:hypothetical protein